MKAFRLLDKIFRFFGYCFVIEIDSENYNIENIFIIKTYGERK